MSALQYDDEGELTGFTYPGANGTSTITYTIRGELASQVYSTIDACGTEGDTAPPLYQKSANGYMVSYVPSSCPGGGPIISWDARTGVGLGNSSNENSSVSYAFDAAGRQTSGTQAWSYTHQCGDQQCEVDGNGTQTRTFDAQNHLLSETTTNWDTPSAGLNGCLTGSIVPANIGGDASTLAWGPNGHPDLWDSMTLHWDGNTPLFVTDSSGAIKEIKIEGLGYYAPAATNPMTFLDRDPAGFVVAAHWSGGHSDWQPSNAYHQVCNTQVLSGYAFYEPGSDGISDGVNTIQGVRNFDPALATWTSPDAYAGDASDPMSRKSYMWNRNNSYAYSDPTGFDTLASAREEDVPLSPEMQTHVDAMTQPVVDDLEKLPESKLKEILKNPDVQGRVRSFVDRALTGKIEKMRGSTVGKQGARFSRSTRSTGMPTGARCAYCGDTATEADHVRSRSQGGGNDITNLNPACTFCNRSKQGDDPYQWIDRLYRKFVR